MALALPRLVLMLSVGSLVWFGSGFALSFVLDAGSAFVVGAVVAGVVVVALSWRLRK